MEKLYAICSINEFSKTEKPRTTAILSEPGQDYVTGRPYLKGHLAIHSEDESPEPPEFDDCFLITVEKLPRLPRGTGWDSYKELIEKRREEDNKPKIGPTSGRIFRS